MLEINYIYLAILGAILFTVVVFSLLIYMKVGQGGLRSDSSQVSELKADIKVKDSELNQKEKQILRLEAEIEKKEKTVTDETNKLLEAKKAFDEEKKRIRQSDLERQKEEEENRNRIWKEHEENVTSQMRKICEKEYLHLSYFDSNNLPEGFDPGLKPDFLIGLLRQYVIFDAKHSKTYPSYLKNQVTSSAEKYKKSRSFRSLYESVFFVVPATDLHEIKETFFLENGFRFYIISVELFEPIVSILKRLEDYDITEKFDPQARESIVNHIASLKQYIHFTNAVSVVTTRKGISVNKQTENLPDDIVRDVENMIKKSRESKPLSITSNEIKRLEDPGMIEKEITKITQPTKPAISQKEIKEVTP